MRPVGARWLICFALGALVASSAVAPAGARPKIQADWPQYGYDAARTGYNPLEDTIGVSNVSQLTRAWRGVVRDRINGVSVANGRAYVGAGDGRLHVFDADGVTNCSGVPKFCEPLWTAMTSPDRGVYTPAVVDGVVYVGSGDGRLYAFDANGVTNCFGVRKRCRPLWYSTVIGYGSVPVVSGGVVYIGGDDGFGHALFAFDAAGVANCQGTPTKICEPLWSGHAFGVFNFAGPAVGNGMVYIGAMTGDLEVGGINAFDAAGITNCSGVPKVCDQIWYMPMSGFLSFAAHHSPSVANGLVYITYDSRRMYAFDAAGVQHCTQGQTRYCSPVWNPGSKNATSDVAVANGVAYVGWQGYEVAAFDAAGITNCENGGHQYKCSPLWTGRHRGLSGDGLAVANGVIYVWSYQSLAAYDAAGLANCAGQPVICDPLWQMGGIDSQPIVVNGMVYAGGTDNDLNVFALP